MFWSKLCKSNRNCAWNFAFISVMTISPIVWTMCEHLHYESVSFKELHKEQEYYWPTMYRAGAAAVSTITSLLVWRSVLKLQSSCHRFETRVNTVKENWGLKKLFTSIKKKRKEEQRWWLQKCLNWVTVTICYGKRTTRQVCPFC